jgi:hypothetical protein
MFEALRTIFRPFNTVFKALRTLLKLFNTVFKPFNIMFKAFNTVFEAFNFIFEPLNTVAKACRIVLKSLNAVSKPCQSRGKARYLVVKPDAANAKVRAAPGGGSRAAGSRPPLCAGPGEERYIPLPRTCGGGGPAKRGPEGVRRMSARFDSCRNTGVGSDCRPAQTPSALEDSGPSPAGSGGGKERNHPAGESDPKKPPPLRALSAPPRFLPQKNLCASVPLWCIPPTNPAPAKTGHQTRPTLNPCNWKHTKESSTNLRRGS